MKKILPLFVNGFIVMGIFGCQTPPNQPQATNTPNPLQTTNTPTTQPTAINDRGAVSRTVATSQTVTNNQPENTTNLRNQIIAELEKNFSNCSLKVQVRGNNVTVTGTVPQANNRQQIQDLVNSIAGVNNVSVNVRVA